MLNKTLSRARVIARSRGFGVYRVRVLPVLELIAVPVAMSVYARAAPITEVFLVCG